MTRAVLLAAATVFVSSALATEAQPPVRRPSVGEAERAQADDLRGRLLERVGPGEAPVGRDPQLEAVFERLRDSRLDRIQGYSWAAPSGRGHRFGEDLAEPWALVGVDRDRRVFVHAFEGDGRDLFLRLESRAYDRRREGSSEKEPIVLWADPSLPAEYVWSLAWMLDAYASEVRLVVTPERVEVPPVSGPLQRRFEQCRRQYAAGLELDCVLPLVEVALEGCDLWLGELPLGDLYRVVLDPSVLYDHCGPRPLVAPLRFEAIWRFLIDIGRPRDTEYLLIDPEQPPPRSARTVQQWVRHLMREQLD